MTEVKVRTVHGVRMSIGLVAALFFGVLAPVLLVNGAAGLFVAGAVVLALLAGIDATFSTDAWLRRSTPAVAAGPGEHTLAA